MAVAAAAAVGMLVTLHPDGIRGYLATLLAPQAAGDMAETLRFALHGSQAVLAIQAAAVLAVIAVAAHARRTHATWPVVVSALLGSFLLATYWHPQDYVVLAAAAAITLAAGPVEVGLLVATAVAVVSTPTKLLSVHEVTVAWLILAIAVLGFLGIRTLIRPRQRGPSFQPVPP
jgi:positive regulator of sigma E activity